MAEVEQPPQNGIDLSDLLEDDNSKARPADIEQDVREMERRKRVEAIMGSKLFREELERIVDCARDSGNTVGLFQQLSDIVGVPSSRVGSVFKASNCMLPINDIRGVESMGYAKGEKILRCKLAAAFRLLDLNGWTQGLGAQITARLKVDQEYFLVNPYGLLYHEITASALNKVDMQGNIVEQGTTNFGVNKSHFILHSIVHAARPDIRCAIYIGCSPVVAIASLKTGLLPLTKDACVLGEVTTYSYTGYLHDEEERNKLVRNLGPNSKVMLLTNHGALCCGETIEEAFFAACHIVQACETQLQLLPVGLDNLVLIPEESRKIIYEQSRRPPEDLEKKFAAATAITDSNKAEEEKKEGGDETTTTTTKVIGQPPKWRVGGAEFEALMRMLDNAGYRTGYIYRHPLIKSDPPKPKNDVELPPAVSSLGYLLEEEELFRQGIWKKGDLRKGGDRSRWLNSPNVYQKVEVLETGTPDPKKITKWVAEGSPTHSTPVRIDDPLQFVPVNTNPREFKRVQQQIKDNRRADKISAGPQSHILEGVTWDEANRIKDATVSSAGDHVVLMGAASKGIIQRGYQHNATVYKTPYAKNPFDNVTDDELNEYKRTVERKKKSIHGEYTDTDFSESEALSSLQTSGAQQQTKQTTTTTTTTTAAVSQSEPEDISEHQVMRIQTKQAPVPSQPEVVLSDASLSFINGERSHTITNRKPPTGRDAQFFLKSKYQVPPQDSYTQESLDLSYHSMQLIENQTALDDVVVVVSGCGEDEEDQEKSFSAVSHQAKQLNTNKSCKQNSELIKELSIDSFFQSQKIKHISHTPPKHTDNNTTQGNGNIFNSSIYKSPSSTLSSNCRINQLVSNDNAQVNNSTFYTSCYGNNTSNNTNYEKPQMYKNSSSEYINSDTAYAKPSYCCTPIICDAVFESLQKPYNLQHQYCSKSQQDLIGNVPFNQPNYTPLFTPENQNTPRKPRAENVNKSCSPYRTVSHFGFNSAQREPQPDHKHLPINMEPKKYIPLRRSISYEEIFSSPRYLDLCENCFEQIVRLKPELNQYRIKLRNLIEHRMPTSITSLAVNSSPDFKYVQSTDDKVVAEDFTNVAITDGLENVNLPVCDEKPHDEHCTIFSSQLEPLIEVEEKDSSEDSTTISITDSTFIDKITRMNYSEESANINFINTPYTVTSQISLPDIEEYIEMESPTQSMINRNINEEETEDCNNSFQMSFLNANNKEETQERLVSLTDIWEFANWLDNVMEQQPPISENNKENIDNFDNPTDETALTNKDASTSTSSINHDLEHLQERNLMTREERIRRKLEFQELWEDHVRYTENREQCGASSVYYSDTESAIDETQHPTSPGLESEQTKEGENAIEEDKEIFHGTSLVYSHTSGINQEKRLQQLREENTDEVDYKSTSSHHTFNISEQNSSEENLLFPIPGSTNIVNDFAICRTAGQNHQQRSMQCGSINLDVEKNDIQFSSAYKPDFEYIRLNVQQAKEQLGESTEKFQNATTSIKHFNNFDNNLIEFEKYVKEFDAIVQHEYDIHSNVSENFENILSEIDKSKNRQCNARDDLNKETKDTDYSKLQTEDKIIDVLEKTVEHNVPNCFNIKSANYKNMELFKSPNEDNNETEEIIEQDFLFLELAGNVNKTFTPTKENGELFEIQNESDNACHNIKESNENVTDQQFSSLERKILKKIEINQLSKSEKIFDKIEYSIRNKITPTKLEMLIKEQALRLCTGTDNDALLYNLTSTTKKEVDNLLGKSFHTSNIFNEHENVCRRSRSLTQLSDYSSPPAKLNKTSTSPMGPRKKQPESVRSNSDDSTTPSPCSSKSEMSSNRKQRNFILENIRNASVPRHTPQIKRLQGNTQAIFGKNPFGPRVYTTGANALHIAVESPSSSSYKEQKSDGSTSAVYAFQSKLVKGSPKFWVSMPQSPNRKSQQKPTLSTKVIRKCKRNSIIQENSNSNVNKLEKYNLVNKISSLTIDSDVDENVSLAAEISGTDKLTKVDAEINALGEEIQEIKPRLETYKIKLDDFGDCVAKCTRNMDECVATQEEIFNEQRELKDRIVLQQFSEEISCRVQTFSLSETED